MRKAVRVSRDDLSQMLSIGELAARSGLTVRTLHHYDRVGLLQPTAREPSGYRCYGTTEVERLYRIRALKSLGLSLAEIAGVLTDGDPSHGLHSVVRQQLEHVRAQQAHFSRLEHDLGLILDALEDGSAVGREELLPLIGEMEMLKNTLRHDYSQQAHRYDASRGVSPDVIEALLTALGDAPGRALLDVGGGTGNYAQALRDIGWVPTVLDASPDMRAEAEAKGLVAAAGDATNLPFADESFDALIMISMLQQVADWAAALNEACRVLRPGGRLAVMGMTAEHLREVAWAYDLFPSMRGFALDRRPSLAEMMEHLPGATAEPIWFRDLTDASIGALCAHPEAMLDPQRRRQTSFFERLERDHPQELKDGLDILAGWLAAEDDPRASREHARRRLGDASVIAWQKR
jgi:DNA-binding transcriptional MerR regulator